MLILFDEIAFFCGKHMNCKISRIRESDKSGNRLLKMRISVFSPGFFYAWKISSSTTFFAPGSLTCSNVVRWDVGVLVLT